MRLWVVGSEGMLGQHVLVAAQEAGHDSIGTSHRSCPLENASSVFLMMERLQPDAIINCAGKLPGADALESLHANSIGPHVLASTGVRLIHMSTDCVYSGQSKGSYTSESIPDPMGHYGVTKRAGEPIEYSHALTVRGSFIGKEGGFLHWLLGAQGLVEAWARAYWSGVRVEFMAKTLVDLAVGSATGIVHVSAPDFTSKADIITYLVDKLDLPVSLKIVHEPAVSRVLVPDIPGPEIHQSLEEIVEELCPSKV